MPDVSNTLHTDGDAASVAFEQRIAQLVAANAVRQTLADAARDARMIDVVERLGRYHALAARVRDDIVLPRLRMIAAHFSTATIETPAHRAFDAGIILSRMPQSPALAQIDTTIGHDDGIETLRVTVVPSILPLLIPCGGTETLECPILVPDLAAIGRFIEDHLARFLCDYYRIFEPGSPYQLGRPTTCPVCLMALGLTASPTTFYNQQTYSFYSTACLAQFSADPGRYLSLA